MNTPEMPRADWRTAIAARFGVSESPLQKARGDIRQAVARRLGVPLLKRPEVDEDDVIRIVPNRADRRRAQSRVTVLNSYSRNLTQKAVA